MVKVSDLPDELLRYLFQMLSPEDLKAVVLTDRKWRQVGEDPVFWKWCIIRINNGNDLRKLSIGRFKYIEEIVVFSHFNWQAHFLQAHQLEKLLQDTLELPKLKEIKGLQLDLNFINPHLLGKSLGKLEFLRLVGINNTTNDQNMAIFKEMAEKGCMKKLRLAFISLLELEVKKLSKVISGLQELELIQVSFTNDQVSAMFTSISENNQLNKIELDSLSVSSVEPELFGKAVTNIDIVNLDNMEISPHQARALFTQMGQNRKIKKFCAHVNLSRADPKLIARGLSKLEEVRLTGFTLTDEQVLSIFRELKQNCKLKVLELPFHNLSSVHPNDLSKVVNNIEVVNMCWCELSTEQITAVLVRTQRNTKLKLLDIRDNDIFEVDPVILATAGEIIEELYVDDVESSVEDYENVDDENMSFD